MCTNAFEAWNLRLLGHFFGPKQQGKEVFLVATPDVLLEIGEDLGGDGGFLDAVNAGPEWKWKQKPCTFESRLLELVERRRSSSKRALGYTDPGKYNPGFSPVGAVERSAPTYLPYLAALARGAAVADAEGYYAGLRKDLALPAGWGSTQMRRTEGAWLDLERWARDTSGRFGSFTFRRLGGYQLVGLARSQVMIASRDIHVLHEIYGVLGAGADRKSNAFDFCKVLEHVRAEGSGVSKGLRQAAFDAEYRDVLEMRLADTYQEWANGRAETPATTLGRRVDRRVARTSPFKFGLKLGPNDSLPWKIIIAVGDSSSEICEDEACTRMNDLVAEEERRALIWRRQPDGWVAELSAAQSAELFASDSWRVETPRGTLSISRPNEPLVLTEGGDEGYQLWDSGWPPFGGATVLFPSPGAESLAALVSALPHDALYPPEQMQGLPPEWAMCRVDACQDLTDAERALVQPNGRAARLIVLQGGTKDEGSYLHYDLPDAVYRGPESWKVVVAGHSSIELIEDAPAPHLRMEKPGRFDGLAVTRRYSLPPELELDGDYRLAVLDDLGKERGGCTFSVQRLSQNTETMEGGICLDRLGKISRGADGLRGGLSDMLLRKHESVRAEGDILGESHISDIGRRTTFADLERNVSVLFLDSLARAGSYSYGRARSKLERYLAKGGSTLTPWRVLIDLWQRGYLEIGRDKSGAIERVYSVQPCAYSLPLQAEGRRVMGLLGTLRLEQWEQLSGESLAWVLLGNDFAHNQRGALITLRLLTKVSESPLKHRLGQIGLNLLPVQCLAIANWAGSEREARLLMTDDAKRISDSVIFKGLKRFDAAAVRYIDAGLERPELPSGVKEVAHYRFEDARRKGWQRSMLVLREGMSFAVDEQWSRWIAMTNAALGLKTAPIFHDKLHRHLYVPSQLRFPIVLDRALIFCSGSPPLELSLDNWEDGDRVKYGVRTADTVFFDVHEAARHGMSARHWLRYENVPVSVVKTITSKGR